MTPQLLRTKLQWPPLRERAVERTVLIERLNAGLACHTPPKLTLISAPAGYGKTTLAVQWVEQLVRPKIWLSLDSGENDLARFLAYLLTAISSVRPALGEAALARLPSNYGNWEAILTLLLNDLAAEDEPLVIVLDDYHLIENEAVHEAVTFILENAPLTLHLVITSRTEPPLPIATLRAHNQVQVVTAQQLRFAWEESAQFLRETMGASLSAVQITQLDEQLEGWVTGLQLASLALADGLTLTDEFSGNHRYIVDYLAEQVLARQSAEITTFLQQTAILSHFCADLCNTVLDSDTQACLNYLDRANLFLVPVDAERCWYRYHHLFGEFLQGRLERTHSAETIATLHRRAAHWYCDHGLPLDAVEHALAAGEYAFSAELIASVARDVLMFGESITLRGWIEQLPIELLNTQPQLVLYYGWTLVRTGDLKRANLLTNQIAEQLDNRTPLLGEWAALRARIAEFKGYSEKNIKFSNKALAHLDPHQYRLRSEVAINLGFSHMQNADFGAARSAFSEAARITQHDSGLWSSLFATYYWGHSHTKQGELHEAFAIFQRGLERANRTERTRTYPSPACGFMHLGLGEILYEWNRLDEAVTHLRQAHRCGERSGDHKMLMYTLSSLAYLLAAQGDEQGAQEMVTLWERRARRIGSSSLRAGVALRCGDVATAEAWLVSAEINPTDPDEKLANWPQAYLLLTQTYLAHNDCTCAANLLSRLENAIASYNVAHTTIKVQLLQALVAATQNDHQSACRQLRSALNRAEASGYVRLFLDTQHPMLPRLLNQVAYQYDDRYARRLLLHGESAEPTLSHVEGVQPLSPRELEVLTYLAQGLDNRAIAEQLTVSINTIKTHTHRLYNKLGVRNRTAAVTRAHALNLLPQNNHK